MDLKLLKAMLSSLVYGMRVKFRTDVETPPVEDQGYGLDVYVHEDMDASFNWFKL